MGSIVRLALITLQFFGFCQIGLAGEFHHEFMGSLNYTQASGSTSNGDTEATEAKQSGLSATLGYGYIFSNWTEMLIEVDFNSEQRKLADFSDGRTGMDLGLGLLFNVPMGDWGKDAKTPRWLPFGGIVISQANHRSDKKSEAESNYDQKGMVTKLVLGNRYFLLPNIALHSSLRASYQTDSVTEKSETGAETKASSNKLMLELHLLSLAVLF